MHLPAAALGTGYCIIGILKWLWTTECTEICSFVEVFAFLAFYVGFVAEMVIRSRSEGGESLTLSRTPLRLFVVICSCSRYAEAGDQLPLLSHLLSPTNKSYCKAFQMLKIKWSY